MYAVDTNILIYALDPRDGGQDRANYRPRQYSGTRRLDGVFQRKEKAPRCERTASGVPVSSLLGIQDRVRMPPRLTCSH